MLLWVLLECLIMPINNDSITFRKLSRLKCWNQLVGNFDVYLHAKKTWSNLFFKKYCKDIANLLFWELCECLIISITIIVSFYRALPCLFACKKSTSSLTSFLRYCKEIANLLFWEIWACLATHTLNDNSNLKKPLKFIYRQKIKLILHVFFEILQRYCKLIPLGTLGISGYANPK